MRKKYCSEKEKKIAIVTVGIDYNNKIQILLIIIINKY